MPPPDNVSPTESIQSLPTAMAAPSMRYPKQRQSLDNDAHPLSVSTASLLSQRDRRATNPSTASLFASTLSPPSSRSSSPLGGMRRPPSRNTLAGSVFGGGGSFPGAFNSSGAASDDPGDPLNLILKSFVPHIAVYGSEDVDTLVADKGFSGGLWELLRPFGESVPGRVTIRDSTGGGRSWDDFAIRFVHLGEAAEDPVQSPMKSNNSASTAANANANANANGTATATRDQFSDMAAVEAVVNRHLSFAEDAYAYGAASGGSPDSPTRQGQGQGSDADADADAADTTSPYYTLYLRRLLSGIPLACHETFAHPVACVVAISSRNPNPIETLRRLYAETRQGPHRLPGWVDPEYLRYYVLVHDEEQSDIAKSMALFDQMKRHLGLHCHLLRLRSSQSAETDDDSIPLPRYEWMTAAEELAAIERSEQQEEDFEDPTRYIFESDATAIRTFVREMVTQSIVPTMERNVSYWNDQVASRRRGISGRLMNLSKRFTVFGVGGGGGGSGGGSGGNRNSTMSSSSGNSGNSNSNYDALGFYRPEAPEAVMRKLADYAFMLRDWKLAMSTYDLLRGDFQNDKAWRYQAAANEMAALALLIMPPPQQQGTSSSSSSKATLRAVETINQMLEQAFYSYHTRCGAPYGAVRCLLLAAELLRLRGGSAVDEAARWAARLLESRLAGPVGDALLRERVAVCYAAKPGVGSRAWGARRRKSALWSVLGAEAWLAQGKLIQARRCLDDARRMYASLPSGQGVRKFDRASAFLAQLQGRLREGEGRVLAAAAAANGEAGGQKDGVELEFAGGEDDADGQAEAEAEAEAEIEIESEPLQSAARDKRRSRRVSALINTVGGGVGSTTGGLETAPLAPPTPVKFSAYEDERTGTGRAGGDGFS